jgi:hypothetical protein
MSFFAGRFYTLLAVVVAMALGYGLMLQLYFRITHSRALKPKPGQPPYGDSTSKPLGSESRIAKIIKSG